VRVRVMKMSHLGLTVRDLDASVAFYTDVLGMRLTERFEYPEDEVGHGVTVAAGAFIRCDATHHQLSLFQLKDGLVDDGGPDPTKPVLGFHHMAFEMATPADLLAKLREMRERGVTIVNCRKGGPGNQPRFYARDPDGYLVEFFWGIDTVGWDGIPREYEEIQEIDLETFDFDAYAEGREQAGEHLRALVDSERVGGSAGA
jgi:catechol 2,3-dioxygenase-like lactoylglutathione lyase family enzyme